VVASPAPPGSFSLLESVSCNTATSCFAVGADLDTGKALVEHWNGSAWKVVSVPSPPAQDLVELTSVSCASASSCYAVGETQKFDTQTALIEHWNGATWSLVPPPALAGTDGSALIGVDCSSATACVAVGFSTTGDLDSTLAEFLNGATWSVGPTPN